MRCVDVPSDSGGRLSCPFDIFLNRGLGFRGLGVSGFRFRFLSAFCGVVTVLQGFMGFHRVSWDFTGYHAGCLTRFHRFLV